MPGQSCTSSTLNSCNQTSEASENVITLIKMPLWWQQLYRKCIQRRHRILHKHAQGWKTNHADLTTDEYWESNKEREHQLLECSSDPLRNVVLQALSSVNSVFRACKMNTGRLNTQLFGRYAYPNLTLLFSRPSLSDLVMFIWWLDG